MIQTLRARKMLTPKLLPDVMLSRELIEKRVFYSFLSEIPADFMTFATSRTKAERVRQHLTKVYQRAPRQEEVDIVTRRLANLAQAATNPRDGIEVRLLLTQYKNDNWATIARCQVCGFRFGSGGDATVDHILPLSLGGSVHEENWQLLCRLCNDQKAHHFGCCDLARVSIISNATFFNQSVAAQLQMLLLPHHPLRYELFERAERRCNNGKCKRKADEIKLNLCVLNRDCMISADNLAVSCEKCATSNVEAKYKLR
jgi:5-methylcytosine-specific restriction endonuclease McrA